MCLYVNKSHVLNPIYEMECIKQMRGGYDGEILTMYQYSRVRPGTGWFMPRDPANPTKEFVRGADVRGGFIHAFVDGKKSDLAEPYRIARDTLPTRVRNDYMYTFKAIARDVVAFDSNKDEIICKALYIPAFDITGAHRHAILTFE